MHISWEVSLEQLKNLEKGWDSYSASPISSKSIARTKDILNSIMSPGVSSPYIVPVSNGSIQLEWHSREADLEIFVPVSGEVTYFYESFDEGIEQEGNLIDKESIKVFLRKFEVTDVEEDS